MRQSYTLDEIKDRLLQRVGQVATHYALPSEGSYEHKGAYWTLNPGRPDRSVGSFCVHVSGPRAGRWTDFATGQHGDLLDLIALSLGCSLADAVREARAFLGLDTESPEVRRQRDEAAARAKARREEAARQIADQRERLRRGAHALWLQAQADLRGTPVEAYLRGRSIDLAELGRQPGALRYLDRCRYEHVDPESGEVVEGWFPAMVAAVVDREGRFVACHRTYLGLDATGRWAKADVPKAKKVLGEYAGGWITLWSGIGPRGGKAPPLREAPPGTAVHVAEGIEDALSAAALVPEGRHLAGISLSNLAGLRLPPQVAEVILIADRDAHAQAREALDRAIAAHAAAGRRVRLWQNMGGGKDLNDALRVAQAAGAGTSHARRGAA